MKKQNNDIEITESDELLGGAELIVEGLATISKEVKQSAMNVTRDEARFLVDTYYQVQKMRIVSDNQIRAIVQSADDQDEVIPLALSWVSKNMRNQEEQTKKMLNAYTNSTPVGRWAKATKGVGPVLAAACLSYFNIDKVDHYNQFWSYAGLNDYNNPWLGKTESAKIVNDLYKSLEDRDKEILSILGLAKKDEKQFKIDFTTCDGDPYWGADQIPGLVRSKYPEYYDIIVNFGEGLDDDAVADFFIRQFVSSTAVTNTVIVELMKRVKRTRKVIVKGLNNMLNSRRKKKDLPDGTWNKADLTGYLAKPPYNLQAKQLVYLLGESFVKVSNRGSLYGRVYAERKAEETVNNANGVYADLAKEALAKKNFGKTTESYKAYIEGRLPAAQIHARAKRHAVQLFLSHLYEAMYMDYHKKPVEHEIYPIAYLGHTDYIGPEVPFEDYISIK